MGHKFAEITFTDAVRHVQSELGTRDGNAKRESGPDKNYQLGPAEAAFMTYRDSFYMASVSETDWPYVQHRGGPAGFVKVIDPTTIGFADFSGNRQYVTIGNLRGNDRVSLFFMDYANRMRLKLLGHVELVDPSDRARLEGLSVPGYPARVERGFLIHVAAFDWNCSQHITPRYTETEVATATSKLRSRIAALEAELAHIQQ